MAAKDKENTGEKPKRSKLKIIFLILFLIILLIGGSIAFWWFKLRQPGDALTAVPNVPAASVGQDAAAGTGQTGHFAGQTEFCATDMPRPCHEYGYSADRYGQSCGRGRRSLSPCRNGS